MYETIRALNAMVFFQTVAKLGSFRQAAEALKTSPSTVSRRISELENLLDAQLFVRTTRSVYLTNIGEQLLKDAEFPVRQLIQATKQAGSARDDLAGLVRIASTYTICKTHILPVLPALYKAHPEIRIELLLNEQVIDIRDQNIDFALRAGLLKDPTLIARKIYTDTVAYFSTPDTAGPHPYIEYASGTHTNQIPQIMVQDMRSIYRLVREGFGGAWLPVTLCGEDEKTGVLIRDTEKVELSFDFHIVFHANRFIPRRTRIVMDSIADYAAELP